MENRVQEAIEKASQLIITRDYSSASNILYTELLKKENSHQESVKLMHYYILTYFFTCKDIQRFYQQFLDANKNLEGFTSIMNDLVQEIIAQLNDFHKKIRYRLTTDFYLQTGACAAFIEKLNTDENIAFETIDTMFYIYEQGNNIIKPADYVTFHSAAFIRIQKQINKLDEKTIRIVNEKNLKTELSILRKSASRSFCKEIDKFETNISLRYIKSEYLSKQFTGLMYISNLHKLHKDLIEKIQQDNIINFLFAHMHHNLVEPFAHLLSRLWYYGHYTTEQLNSFWELTFQQHHSEIGNFFAQWPRLYESIPQDRIGEFWQLITSTKQYPPASYRFLIRVSYNCPDFVRKSLLETLWETQDYEVVYAFLPKTKSEKYSYFYKALDIKTSSERFSLQVLNNLWESGISSYDEIVNMSWNPANYDLLLRLLTNITKNTNYFSHQQFEATKKILVDTNPTTLKNFLSEIRFLLSQEAQANLLTWACDHGLSSDVVIWIYKNFPSSNSDSLWKLIFDHKRNEISSFVVDNALEIETNEAIMSIINKCSTKVGNIGSLVTLGYLIRKVEDSLDFETLNIRRNLFTPPESLFIVNITGAITKTVKIYPSITVTTFKKYCSNLINSVDAIVLFDNIAISPNHQFANEQKFAVYRKTTTPARQWLHDELPSVIIRRSAVFGQLFQLMNTTNSDIAVNSLHLLNLMDTSQSDIENFQNSIICGDFSGLLDITHPLLLQYRLHHLAKLISENNKNFVDNAALPATKSLLNILLNESVRNEQYIGMLIRCISMLMNFEKTKEVFIEIGAERGINSLSNWILDNLRSHQTQQMYLSVSLFTFFNKFVSIDPTPLTKLKDLDELFSLAMFESNMRVASFSHIAFSKLPLENLENLVVKNISKSAHNCSREFFILLKQIADNTQNPYKLFSILFNTLKDNLLIPKDIHLREDIPEDITGELSKSLTDKEETDLKLSVRDLTGNLADSYFVNGIIDSLSILFPKVETDEDGILEQCLEFLVSNILLNTWRYIEKPYLLTQLVLDLTKRTHSPILLQHLTQFLSIYNTDYVANNNYSYLCEMKGPRGIINLGCTCYLNSAMQIFFRIKDAKDAILSYCSNDESIDKDEYAQFQLFICQLCYLPCSAVDPTIFIKTWKGFGKQLINTIEQQDSSEFLQSLLDKIDEKVQKKENASQSVRGTILHVMKGIGNKFQSESRDEFTLLTLEVKNNKNFEDAFKTFLQPDIIQGYNTETELGNIDIERYHYLEKAPDVLLVQLKRFEFDLMTGDRKKLNSYFEFPLVADFSPIMQCPQDSTYSLCGIIVHNGTSAGGHYFTYAKEGEKWLCFNDSHVQEILMKPEEMIKTMFGGNTTHEIYDPDYNSMKTETCEKTTSAYVLFYKKISSNKEEKTQNEREPIEMMPKRMVKYFVESVSQMIVHETMANNEVVSLITSLTQIEESSDFIFDYFFKVTNCSEEIRKSIVASASKEEFANFVLKKVDFLIDILLKNKNEALRQSTIELTNTAMLAAIKEMSKNFIDVILSKLDTFYDYWRNLDDIFAPILFYEKNIELCDISNFLLDFVLKVDEKIPKSELSEFVRTVKLSRLFECINYILEKTKSYSTYRQKIVSKNLMDRWFTSDQNAFNFSMLVMSLIKDSAEMNNEYFSYLNSQKDQIQPNVVAAHFATACSFSDSLQKSRLQWFYSFIRSKNWNANAVAVFLNETAVRLSHTTSTVCSLVFSPEIWLEKWLLNNEQIVRNSCENLLYSLIPKCQRLNKNIKNLSSEKVTITDIEKLAFSTLFESLKAMFPMMLNQSLQGSGFLLYKKPSDSYISCMTFFDSLSWVVYYGGFQDRVKKEFGGLIAKSATILSQLKYNQNCGIISLCHFLYIFEFKFDSTLSQIFINCLSNMVLESEFVNFLSAELLPLISNSDETFNALLESKLFRHCAFYSLQTPDHFYSDSAVSVQHIIESYPLSLSENVAAKIWTSENVKVLFSSKIFVEISRYLVNLVDDGLDGFIKSNMLCLVTSHLSLLLSKSDWHSSFLYSDLFYLFTRRFIELRKGKTSYFIFNRMSLFIEFCKTSQDLVKTQLKSCLDVTIPQDLSLQLIETVKLMITCDFSVIDYLLSPCLSCISNGGWKRLSLESSVGIANLLCQVSKMSPASNIQAKVISTMVNCNFYNTKCSSIILRGNGGFSNENCLTLFTLFDGIMRSDENRSSFVCEFLNLMCEVSKSVNKTSTLDIWVSVLFSDVKLGAVPQNLVAKVVNAMLKFETLSQVKTKREITDEQLHEFPEKVAKALKYLSHS